MFLVSFDFDSYVALSTSAEKQSLMPNDRIDSLLDKGKRRQNKYCHFLMENRDLQEKSTVCLNV